MGKKKVTNTVSENTTPEKNFYGVEVNGVLYYFDEYDTDAIRGLLLMKKVVEDKA